MSSEESGESTVSIRLPTELQEWLDEAASRRDIDRDALVRELIGAHKAIEGTNGDSPGAVDRFDPGITEGRLEQETEDLRGEFMELLEDVRKRVIQVKKETDAKASADHHHEDLDRIETLAESLEEIDETVDDLDATLSEVESDLESGFDNYEEILEHILDTIDDLDAKTTTLAKATIQSRERVHEVVAAHRKRAAVDDLKLAASQYGIETAVCENCGTSIRIALLTAPECPHCAETFATLRPKSGLFGKPTLETGKPPALTGSAESELDQQLEAQIDADGDDDSAADIDWKQHSRDQSGEQ